LRRNKSGSAQKIKVIKYRIIYGYLASSALDAPYGVGIGVYGTFAMRGRFLLWQISDLILKLCRFLVGLDYCFIKQSKGE
jgi:hypothetical protein